MNRRKTRTAFSLVELLVVIAIMALLIGIALPRFNRVRDQAKVTATSATLSAIETGLGQFQAESALGGTLPPAASDRPDRTIVNPYDTVTNPGYTAITGASLLCYALAGPDENGTAGFRPEMTDASKPYWGDWTGGYKSGGMYDTTREPPVPRYGAYAGTGLVDSMLPLKELTKFPLPALLFPEDSPEINQRVFVDSFGAPILYYRGRQAARAMIYDYNNGRVGIYDHRDNNSLTKETVNSPHKISDTGFDKPGEAGYRPADNTFDKFILDEKASTFEGNDVEDDVLRAVPGRKDFLLISAGRDRAYGTEDDITNWERTP